MNASNYLRLTRALLNLRVTVLMDAGFNLADAARWARVRESIDPPNLADAAAGYRDHGFAVRHAIQWRNHGYQADAAASMASNGWTLQLAIELHVGVLVNGVAGGPLRSPRGDLIHTADHWLELGMPPDLTLLYLQAGFAPHEALGLEERRANGEDIVGALQVLAALR
ncbi:hypothetical protein [Nocardioides sp. WS12]|uniref:hypothetical protein n=1 Tax=Nocardioides sp. WS12 TaxID=2486272 RepID=UPI0015FB8E98|nr:hypothetical protein [Nocardioides sp. WS12]